MLGLSANYFRTFRNSLPKYIGKQRNPIIGVLITYDYGILFVLFSLFTQTVFDGLGGFDDQLQFIGRTVKENIPEH